jgi:hypothetical protein
VRVGGANPAALAANVASAMDRRRPTDKTAGLNAFDAVIIADPASPDAAAAAELASARRLPYLFVNGDSIPPETSAALAALNINLAYVVGGPNVVGDGAVSQLASTGRNPQRFGGPNQYATSGAIVQESVREGEPANQVFLADGDNPLHGALLGSASARIGGLLLLTPRGNVAAVQSIISALHLPPFDRAIVSQLTRPIP